MSNITNLQVTTAGAVTWTNSAPRQMVMVMWRPGTSGLWTVDTAVIKGSGSYAIPSGEFPVDAAVEVRVYVGEQNETVTVSAPTPTPAPAVPVLSGMTASLLSGDVAVTVGCSSNTVNVVLYQGDYDKVAPDATPQGGEASWTVADLPAGEQTLYAQGFTVASGETGGQASAVVSVTVDVPAPAPAPPPAPTPGVTLASSPSVPDASQHQWVVGCGDTFSNGELDTTLWLPNRTGTAGNEQPDNKNELVSYNASQVSCGANGLELELMPQPPDNLGHPFLSGTVRAFPGVNAIRGFAVAATQRIVHEYQMMLPSNAGGFQDSAFWLTNLPWTAEWDLPEWQVGGYGAFCIFQSTSGGVETNAGTSGNPYAGDGIAHRFTIDVQPAEGKAFVYIDRELQTLKVAVLNDYSNEQELGYIPIPSGDAATTQISPIFQYSLRDQTVDITEPRSLYVRSYALYYVEGAAPEMTGGGLGAGTVVA